MPENKLRKDIVNALEFQRRFPLETSLAMLGRFRSSGFHHFKKGKKGIAYVAYVKRKRRKPHEKFSPSLESLLSFVEKNPLTEKATLAEKHNHQGLVSGLTSTAHRMNLKRYFFRQSMINFYFPNTVRN